MTTPTVTIIQLSNWVVSSWESKGRTFMKCVPACSVFVQACRRLLFEVKRQQLRLQYTCMQQAQALARSLSPWLDERQTQVVWRFV